ncbi:MAG: hypothetical protein J7480_08445 [Microbacteriaceae bacterium]|nr:hypothetical protein [Microbacteriaceae bacterium]
MAFTAWEFIRGALMAILYFNLLTMLVFGVTTGGFGLLFAPFWSVPWSFGAAIVLGPTVVLPVAVLLRRTRSRTGHALVYAGLGLVVGIVVSAVGAQTGWAFVGPAPASGAGFWQRVSAYSFSIIVVTIDSAIAVPAGWYWSMRRARRDDTRPNGRAQLPSPA